MPNQVSTWLRAAGHALLALFCVCPVLAQTRYVIEAASGTNVPALSTRYGFGVASASRGTYTDLYVVTTLAPLTTTTLAQLRCEPGIREVEGSRDLLQTEREAAHPGAALEPLGAAFASRAMANFHGNPVLAAYVNQRGANLVRIADAQRIFGLGSGIVAIVDTGVDVTHPALRGVLLPGYDFTQDRPDTVHESASVLPPNPLTQSTVEILDSRLFALKLDQSTVEILDQSTVEILDGVVPKAFGHGTMVAGLVHLVAPNARILPLKAFRPDGSADIYDIARAIRYAADAGANVINLSLSYTTDSPILRDAVAYAQQKGAICVASAGNLGKEIKVYPAAYPNVIGVGSANFSDKRSPFSNYGDAVRTSAPGEALITLYPGGNYAAVWGTSFSAPLVTGAISQIHAIAPKLRAGAIRDSMDYGVPIRQDMGDARLDLVQLLTYVLRR